MLVRIVRCFGRRRGHGTNRTAGARASLGPLLRVLVAMSQTRDCRAVTLETLTTYQSLIFGTRWSVRTALRDTILFERGRAPHRAHLSTIPRINYHLTHLVTR